MAKKKQSRIVEEGDTFEIVDPAPTDKYVVDVNTYDDIEEWAKGLINGDISDWVKPTAAIKKEFGFWVDDRIKIEKDSAKAGEGLKMVYERLHKEIRELFAELRKDAIKKEPVDAYSRLSLLVGKIKYVKSLNINWEEVDLSKLSNAALALYFVFIGQIVTKNNLRDLEREHKRKVSNGIVDYFVDYNGSSADRINRKLIHHNAIDNFLKDYIAVLPILKMSHPDKYKLAFEEFEIISKKNYPERYNKIILPSNP